MMGLITSQGWQAILPDALPDNHLLLMSDQIRDLLSGDGWNGGDREPASAALPLTLLLLTKAGESPRYSRRLFGLSQATTMEV